MCSKDINYNSFFITGQTYHLNNVVEVVGMSGDGQNVVKENGHKWQLKAINGRLDRAWFTSLQTGKTISVQSNVDSHFVIFPLMEEEGE